ncbi:hypothetical protein DOTSEDRAFT_74684 [Dothistroma septosporum NZE10]|uniref:Uncharacterized protein n=1 Tax=Dothistroma septosporum (strain NZE10 / CBS 128990) TaxID=675120 RepID=N1PCU3_DOTSN|nr:hypothetical protein DOTSEDRAFT_74684 [Dothistroma septosporum NZE10]
MTSLLHNTGNFRRCDRFPSSSDLQVRMQMQMQSLCFNTLDVLIATSPSTVLSLDDTALHPARRSCAMLVIRGVIWFVRARMALSQPVQPFRVRASLKVLAGRSLLMERYATS